MLKETVKKWSHDTENTTLSYVALWMTVVSGSIALANFLYSIFSSATFDRLGFAGALEHEWPVRWLIFLALETCLAYIFGKSLVRLQKFGHGVPYLCLVFISILSAWISLFNVQWLISGPHGAEGWGFLEHNAVKFAVGYFVAGTIALYLIWHHGGNSLGNKNNVSVGVQSVVFLIIATGFLFRN